MVESAGAYTKADDFSAHAATLTIMGTACLQCWYRDPAAGEAIYVLHEGQIKAMNPGH